MSEPFNYSFLEVTLVLAVIVRIEKQLRSLCIHELHTKSNSSLNYVEMADGANFE